jgi:inhibitor of cysteine peptidase
LLPDGVRKPKEKIAMNIRRIQVVFSFLAIVSFLAGAGCSTSPAKLTSKDAGTTVHVAQGHLLEIQLEGNPTTGYTWEAAPDSSSLLVQQGEPQFKADSSALGSGGLMTLRFKAEQKGTGVLKLIYHRTFEPNVAPLRTVEFTLVVE